MNQARIEQWTSIGDRTFNSLLSDIQLGGWLEHRQARGRTTPGRRDGQFFEVLGRGSERHGVWEWTAYTRYRELDRYLVLQVDIDSSEEADAFAGASPCWLLTVVANTVHFERRLIAHEVISDPEYVSNFLSRHLDRAVEVAVSLSAADLRGTYVAPQAMALWRRRNVRR